MNNDVESTHWTSQIYTQMLQANIINPNNFSASDGHVGQLEIISDVRTTNILINMPLTRK